MLQAGFYDMQSHEKNKRVGYYFGSGCLKTLAHYKILKIGIPKFKQAKLSFANYQPRGASKKNSNKDSLK